jgi:hypothetical protein
MKFKAEGLEFILEFARPDSEGWIQTSVNIKTPYFTGGFSCSILESELDNLRIMIDDLEKKIGHNAEITWGNIEDNIQLEIKLTRLGKIEGKYKFSSTTFSKGPTLSGSFEADQTYLRIWKSEFNQAIENAR